ncbi:MAG: hypothetical protein WBN02_14950, partial [Sedimenticolaceae bacterium]
MQTSIVRQPDPDALDGPECPAGIPPLLWRIYRTRGIAVASELERDLSALIPPDRMAGLDEAVTI